MGGVKRVPPLSPETITVNSLELRQNFSTPVKCVWGGGEGERRISVGYFQSLSLLFLEAGSPADLDLIDPLILLV